jgi:adenylate cyclase
MATPQRRLSAILHADVAGFVRLMEGDEDLTVRHLKTAQAEVWRPAIEIAGGALVDSAGDSLLAEFGSARAAVAAAIDIQERMAHQNEMLAEERRLMLRIGVHLGEVIVDESGHVFGDGVNLAARIQSLADPGGIAVSRAVRDIIEPQDAYALVDGGEHRAKNVSRPLHIYHVRVRTGASTRTTTSAVPLTTLRFQGADLAGRKFGFELAFDRLAKSREGIVIGRDVDQCEVVLLHPTVSRRHARLLIAANTLQIEDLGSTNGTSVDGSVVISGVLRPLQTGARLRIGDVELTVRYDDNSTHA